MFQRFVAIALVLPLFALAAAGQVKPKAKSKEPTGNKIVEFCHKNLGKRVGDGECSTLAENALKNVGAQHRGDDDPNEDDYTWGKLVLTVDNKGKGLKTTGKIADVQPGDIIQFRNAKFAGRSLNGNGTYTMSFSHHTAVVVSVQGNGRIVNIYHQNYNDNKTVQGATLQLGDLQGGWLRFYQPVK